VKSGYRGAAGVGVGAGETTNITASDHTEVDRKIMRLASPRLLSVDSEEEPERNNTVKNDS
jgi:hypothetical protein